MKCYGYKDDFYPTENAPPGWFIPPMIPVKLTNKTIRDKKLQFNLTENVCGLTVSLCVVKRGFIVKFFAYNKDNEKCEYVFSNFPKIRQSLADIRKNYNANEIILQAKVLENKNYYNIMPKILAFALYIDGVEQPLQEMAYILREYNIEIVPVLGINKVIDEKTKENYSAQSMLSNVPSKGIICTNRQKSLSFLL